MADLKIKLSLGEKSSSQIRETLSEARERAEMSAAEGEEWLFLKEDECEGLHDDLAAAEDKRIAAVKKEKEVSDARRENNINARAEAKAKQEEEKGKKTKKARDEKPKAAAEDVIPAITPAGGEDEAASAMLHAQEVAANEGDEVKENEDGETQQRDFTSEGPHAASEGENTNDEGGEDELTSVDAPENESGEEGGEEDEEEEKEESGEAEADLQPETRWQVMGKGGGTVET